MTEETRALVREFADRPIGRSVLALGWCVLGVGIVLLELRPKAASSEAEFWWVLVPLSLAIAIGAIWRVAWFRWVAIPGGVIALVSCGAISVAALYPQLAVWWLGVIVVGFGLLTVLVGLAGFAENQGAA